MKRLNIPRLFAVFVSLFLLSVSSNAAIEVTHLNANPLPLSGQLSILEDFSGKLSIEDISSIKYENSFVNDDNATFAIDKGYSKSVWWLRLVFKNNSDGHVLRLIEIANSHLAYINFFEELADGSYREIRTGHLLPFDSRAYKASKFIFPVELNEKSERTYYFQVKSPTRILMPINLWEIDKFNNHEKTSYAMQGAYFGMTLVVLIYNLFIYFALREKIYLYYIGFVINLSLGMASINGSIKEFIAIEYDWWWLHSASLFFTMIVFFLFLFAREFLGIKKNLPGVDRFLKICMLTFLLPIPVLLVATEQMFFYSTYLISFFVLTVIFIINIKLVFRRQRSAYFFLLAYLVPFVIFSINSLSVLKLIPQIWDVGLSSQLGSAVEMLVLALALADRTHQLRLEKERGQKSIIKLQDELVETLRKSEGNLSNLVDKRVSELRRLIDMLSHEIKTPMSVVRMFLGMEKVTPKAKHNAMQAIQDIDAIIERCIDADYIDHGTLTVHRGACDVGVMLEELSVSKAEEGRIALDLHSSVVINTDAKLLRVIISNLIENAVKYSPERSTVGITLSVHHQQGSEGILICFKNEVGLAGLPDPGRIFEKYYRGAGAYGRSGSGLGLYLVRSLTELLGGSIRYQEGHNEVVFDLWIPR